MPPEVTSGSELHDPAGDAGQTGSEIEAPHADAARGAEDARPEDEPQPARMSLAEPPGEAPLAREVDEPVLEVEEARALSREHLRGLLEALVFASDKPLNANELARSASAPLKHVKMLLSELKETYRQRGIVLDEVAGGWIFRTNVQFAPFVREMTSERPVKLTRAQVETLAIAAYRQPITRPEIDDIRGVDSGATLKLLLERELVRILGKKDEPGRPLLYGTTGHFLEFFGLKSLKDLPTLREFTELSDESKRVAEAELAEILPEAGGRPPLAGEAAPRGEEASGGRRGLENPIGTTAVGQTERSGEFGRGSDSMSDPSDAAEDFAASSTDAAAVDTEDDVHDTMIPSAPPTGELDELPAGDPDEWTAEDPDEPKASDLDARSVRDLDESSADEWAAGELDRAPAGHLPERRERNLDEQPPGGIDGPPTGDLPTTPRYLDESSGGGIDKLADLQETSVRDRLESSEGKLDELPPDPRKPNAADRDEPSARELGKPNTDR